MPAPLPPISRAFVATVFFLACALLAFPLAQAFANGGLVFYTNGLDEGSYLQYDFAKLALAHYLRPSQAIVVGLHDLGLSGGWTNLLFDAVTLTLFPLLIRGTLVRLGVEARRSELGALVISYLPLAFLTFNPLLASLFEWNVASGAVRWVTTPHTHQLPLTRTPEPQISLLIVAFASWIAAEKRSLLPLYAAIPFLYSFVAVPFGFFVLTLQFHRWLGERRWWWAVLAATAACGVALAIYFQTLLSPNSRVMIVSSRLPLLSVTGSLALCLWLALRTSIPKTLRVGAGMVAASLFFAANEQILSGALAQPSNYEQYVGVIVVATLLALGLGTRVLGAVTIASIVLVGLRAFATWKENEHFAGLKLPAELHTALRTDAASVAADSLERSVVLNLVLPRQRALATSASRTYLLQGRENLDGYRCVRKQLLETHTGEERLTLLFRALDHLYRYENNDYVLNLLDRKPAPPPLDGVEVVPTTCPERPLHLASGVGSFGESPRR